MNVALTAEGAAKLEFRCVFRVRQQRFQPTAASPVAHAAEVPVRPRLADVGLQLPFTVAMDASDEQLNGAPVVEA